jgi:hypothetical protein
VKSRKKEHHPLVWVKTLDDHHTSVLFALNVNLHKSRALCDITERNTYPVSYVYIPIAITSGLEVVDPSTENTSRRIIYWKMTKSTRYWPWSQGSVTAGAESSKAIYHHSFHLPPLKATDKVWLNLSSAH